MPAATPTLPAQVSPPAFALSGLQPHALSGVEVLALPFTVATASRSSMTTVGSRRDALGLDLLEVLEAARARGRAGEVVTVPVGGDGPGLVLLVGLGDETPRDFRRAGAAVARATFDHESVATTVAVASDADALTSFVVGMMLGSFVFHWRSQGPEHEPVRRVVLAGLSDDDHSAALERGLELGGAGWRARMLATVPSNLKSPQWLAEQAEQLAADHGLGCEIWDERHLAKHGFGGILGVGAGSATPPRLIRLDYTPPRGPPGAAGRPGRQGDHLRLRRPLDQARRGDVDDEARHDRRCGRDGRDGGPRRARLSPARHGPGAGRRERRRRPLLRPGDVVTHYGGRTSEVMNTDAEGRLVLADAMAFAVAELDPAVLVDVATLTGAIKVALGQWTGGFFANRDPLAPALVSAGAAAGEPLWRLPLEPDYEDTLASSVADATNAPGGPGAITAALYLQHFAGGLPWAHLDIASTGDAPSESFEWTKGPTGFGARLLLTWLTSQDPLAGIA